VTCICVLQLGALRHFDMLALCTRVYVAVFVLWRQNKCVLNRHIVHLYNTTTGEKLKVNNTYQKEAHKKLTKGLLDMIILQYLDHESMHGYQLIIKIRKGFGVNFGASTIYPLLGLLGKKVTQESTWNMDSERPRKMYKLTNAGKNVLSFTESSLNLICKNITNDNKIQMQTSSLISTRTTHQKENQSLIVS